MIIYSLRGLSRNEAVLVTSLTMLETLAWTPRKKLKVAKKGDTITGALAMSNCKVTCLAGPIAAQEAVTKDYVDTVVSIVM